jgi:predicted AlkP superfamily phosphohydrolase/phosphomutase
MALHELSHDDTRLVTAIFTATDRIQHMFSRYDWTDVDLNGEKASGIYRDAIDQSYVRMDDFIGRVLSEHVGPDDILLVVSDHGFAPWRRAVNLNRFLIESGYLTLRDRTGARSLVGHLGGGAALQQVDWSKTRAYSVGLGKIYLNLKGREPQGIVTAEEAPRLIEQIDRDLLAMVDGTQQVVSAVTRGLDAYKGDAIPEGAADIYVGFHAGYRVSWQSCLGGADEPLVFDNRSAWSGDHCSVDPSQVPGVLFCNQRLSGEDPRVVDIAPTVMDLFGFALRQPDSPLDGHSLIQGK